MVEIGILLVLVGQTWAKAYDAGWGQQPSCDDTVCAIACDTFDYDTVSTSYVLVGHTYPGPLGGTDAMVIKVNAKNGNVIWSKAYGFPFGDIFSDFARAVMVDYEGESVYYVIAGYTKPGFLMIDRADALVFKVRATDGGLVWGWLYSGMYYDPMEIRTDDYAFSLCKDGGSYIVGGNIEPGPGGGESDVLAFKVDAATGLMPYPSSWSRAYGVDSSGNGTDDYAYSIIEDLSTEPCTLFVVAGKSYRTDTGTSDMMVFKGRKSNGSIDQNTRSLHDYILDGLNSCAYSIRNDHESGYILTGNVDTSIVVMKINPNLSAGWGGMVRRYSIPDQASSRCIEPTSDGNYIFSGFTSPGIQAQPGLIDLLVTKIDSGGTIIWSKILKGCSDEGTLMSGSDYGLYIIESPPDTYVVIGYTDWPLQSSWNPANILVARMDSDGAIPCPQSDTCMYDIQALLDSPSVSIDTSFTEYDIGMQLIEIEDSSIYIHDSVICHQEVTSIQEGFNHNSEYYLGTTPNLFTSETVISYVLNEDCNVLLGIYDISGRLVSKLREGHLKAGTYTYIWKAMNDNGVVVAPGIYFTRLQADGCSECKKIVFIR